MKRLLWTGAGFIGSNFIEMFHRDYEITVLDDFGYASQASRVEYLAEGTWSVDCGNADEVNELFEEENSFDIVVHAAAQTHVDNSIKTPGPFIQSNIVGTFNMLEACRKYEVPQVLYFSTDEVLSHYGNPEKGWANRQAEVDLHDHHGMDYETFAQFDPSSVYSASKASGEMLCNAYKKTYGMKIDIIRPCNNYGPNQNQEKLIPKAIDCILKGKPVPVFHSPALRDWLYVQDCCRAVKHVLDLGKGDIFHISAHDERRTADVVQMIIDIMGSGEIEYVEDRKGYDLVYGLDSSKLRETGWEPKVSFEEGLKRTIDHYKEIHNA